MAILPNALSYIYKEFLATPPIGNIAYAILRMTFLIPFASRASHCS
jgi:hypothetical protein